MERRVAVIEHSVIGSVIAYIVAYYVCKWLDGILSGDDK